MLAEIMEVDEVDEVDEVQGQHDLDRRAVRHGHEDGEVTLCDVYAVLPAVAPAVERVRAGRPPAHRSDPVGSAAADVRRSVAGALSITQARVASPGFTVDNHDDARAIAEIVAASLGVPLAIEIAAGALASRTLAEIARGITDQVRLLAASQRGRALEGCYRQLDRPEQALWERLSVFDGGFSREAVEREVARPVAAMPTEEPVTV